MSDYCRKAVCGQNCLAAGEHAVGAMHRGARLAALEIAIAAGVVFIGALASLPGYRRHRRGPERCNGFPAGYFGGREYA